MRALIRVAAALIAVYLGCVAFLYVKQDHLLYPGARGGAAPRAAEAGLDGFEDLTLATRDGQTLAAWWKPPEPGKPVVLYLHGNGGSLASRARRVALLSGEGRGLMIASYRGYPGSSGRPSEEGLAEDARTAYDAAATRAPQARVVAYGESLGSGIAVRLATERRLAGLVLDSPYSSTADVAQSIYWYVPVRLLMRDQFRADEIIGRVAVPLLVMHGDADTVIPIPFGEKLFAAASEPKRFLRLPGVRHSGVLEHGGLAAVESFLGGIEQGGSGAGPAQVAVPAPVARRP